MILEISTALWEGPIVVDTDEPSSPGPGPLAVIKPRIVAKLDRKSGAVFSWTPHGNPAGSPLPGLLIIGVAVVLSFAVIGVVKTIR